MIVLLTFPLTFTFILTSDSFSLSDSIWFHYNLRCCLSFGSVFRSCQQYFRDQNRLGQNCERLQKTRGSQSPGHWNLVHHLKLGGKISRYK